MRGKNFAVIHRPPRPRVPIQNWPRFHGAVAIALLFALSAPTLVANEIEIRLVAADRAAIAGARPLVSDLVDFRRSPDGGLIATQWLSGVLLGDRPLFPITQTSRAPARPTLKDDPSAKPKTKADTDDLLAELKRDAGPAKPRPPRPADVIDELYQGKTFSDGSIVGPQRSRASSATIEITTPTVVAPGGQSVAATDKLVEIPAYPVTLTVVSADDGRTISFVPQLTWRGRDLLADCLFEHSPDLPLGDLPGNQTPANLEARWAALQGGNRLFRRLTIYLPATGPDREPYWIDGHPFVLSDAGAKPATGKSPAPKARPGQLRASDKFSLQIVQSAPSPAPVIRVPVLTSLPAGWKSDLPDTLALGPEATTLELRLTTPGGTALNLQPRVPVAAADRSGWHLYALLTAGSATENAIAYCLAIRRAELARAGQFEVRVSVASPAPVALPGSFAAKFTPWFSPDTNAANPAVSLEFRSTAPGEYTANIGPAPPGLHRLTPDFAPASGGVPVVIAAADAPGSVTLATYHNRSDYLRGEQIQLALILRARHAIAPLRATLALHDSAGTRLALGPLALECPTPQTRTVFVTIPTHALEPGTYRVALEAPGLVTYPTEFTLYSHIPRTTFALYSWMSASFSGPVRAGDEVLVNCLLDEKPSRALSPAELAAHTARGPLDARFRDLFAADPLFPAPERTLAYDPDTELEMAIAMRLGLRYAPPYGWGLNDQEAAWNPKHTLPDELDRIRRLCTQVTQRHRAFGNFAGLHLNWYPTYGGYWENQPQRDGNVRRRAEQLQAEVAQLHLPNRPDDSALTPDEKLDLAVARSKHYTGALPRAYQAWTAQARALRPGLTDGAPTPASALTDQPGLSPDAPVYSSFLPVSWFDHQRFWPSTYFSGLPVATVHAYTDYGFSPFQHLWSLDHWSAGLGTKPKWVTSMSNGRDILLNQALLAVARGADGLDLHGSDPVTASVLARFLAAYGPFFRALEPESDIAILTSLRQQISGSKLVGRWMGYTGGDYFDLYTKLWYARRPAAMLPEEEVTPERLKSFKAIFLVGQQVRLPEPAMQALAHYAQSGGVILKDKATAAEFPGRSFELIPQAPDGKKLGRWDGVKYQATRDQMFVGTLAAYEAVAEQLTELLAPLAPARVSTPTHEILTASLGGPGQDVAAAMIVNDTHPYPGIVHPWNFWSATIIATRSQLLCDKLYFAYDLLASGQEIRATAATNAAGRFTLPVSFDRCSARAFILTERPIRGLTAFAQPDPNGELLLSARISDDQDREFQTPLPCEITRLDATGRTIETLYRALGPKHTATLPAPTRTAASLRIRELASGLTAQLSLPAPPVAPPTLAFTASPTLIPRPSEVRAFFAPSSTQAPSSQILLLLDPRQLARDPSLREHADQFAKTLRARHPATDIAVQVADPLEIIAVAQRWQPTARDRAWQTEALAGRRILAAESLDTRYNAEKRTSQSTPDYLHPWSGFGEPAARHRIHRHVILLGTPANNRFLADLESTLEQRASENFPAPGSALIQVVHDAFVAHHHALTIQSPDTPGLLAGLRSLLATLTDPAPQKIPLPQIPLPNSHSSAATKTPLPNPLTTSFGAAVSPLAFTPDGTLLASADTQSGNYFQFDRAGHLTRNWLGKYGLQPSATGATLWLHDWWGAPGWLDKIIRADATAQPQWQMSAPRWSASFQGWQHPGSRWLTHPTTDDLFIAGHHQLSRLTAAGKVVWQYDDLATANDVESFRFSRDLMLHDVSRDGRHLLAAAFGVVPYARFVSSFNRPAVLLLDAATGKTRWTKPGVLIDHSACAFAGDKILLADATPEAKRLTLLDLNGKELWSLARPAGTSRAALTPDGTRLIVRPESVRDRNHQVVGEPLGLQVITLADRTTREFPLTDTIAHWAMLADGRVLVSTRDGRLRCFTPDTQLVWEQNFAGPCNLLVAPDGQQIALGTPTGQLRWLDPSGKVLREYDVNPHNLVTNPTAYVRAYTATPAAAPVTQPTPDAPSTIDQRARGTLEFSANLLDPKTAATLADSGLQAPVTTTLQLAANSTYVLSLLQRTAGGLTTREQEMIAVEVKDTATGKVIYAARVPLSASWQERTFSWKTPRTPIRATLTLRHSPDPRPKTLDARPQTLPSASPELRQPALFLLKFPSPNRLAQRVPDAASDPFATTRANPPSVRYFLPNDVDLAARARGAAPFTPTVEFTVPFDGQLDGRPTSWLNRPVTASTHARLELKYDRPVKLSSLAVYEDPADPARYTDTYALFLHDAKRNRWLQAGHVTDNRSPYNLFTFPTIEADAISYLWLRSPDGHARLAELEAYSPPADLLD